LSEFNFANLSNAFVKALSALARASVRSPYHFNQIGFYFRLVLRIGFFQIIADDPDRLQTVGFL
jgi:hypothetical protein